MTKTKGIGRGKNPNSHNISKFRKEGGGKAQAKLNPFQKGKMINDIIRWMFEDADYSKGQIKEMIQRNAPVPLSDDIAYGLINAAADRLEEITSQDAETVVSLHLALYEELYAYFKSIDHAVGMNKMMKQKEKLIGIHKEERKVVITDKQTVVINRHVEYDLNRLSEADKIRLQELMDKAK